MAHDVSFKISIGFQAWARQNPPPVHNDHPMSCLKRIALFTSLIAAHGVFWTSVWAVTGKTPLSCDLLPINIAPHCLWQKYAPFQKAQMSSENEALTSVNTIESYVSTSVPECSNQLYNFENQTVDFADMNMDNPPNEN